jgi:hypothetical protein
MCDTVDPANFQEAGCAVCGLLVPFTELTPKADLDLNYNVLNATGVTCKEQTFSGDPIAEIEGPVIADDCDHVCTDCEA